MSKHNYSRLPGATRAVSLVSLAFVLCATGALAQNESLTINDQEYFQKRGLDVLVFTNEYNGMFFDEKTAGIEIIHHGVRTATGGAVRLNPTPEQWDQIPKVADRKVDPKTNTIEVTLRYEAFDFDSRLVVTPDGAGFRIAVYVDKPVPAQLEGRAGLNLEFRPSRYWERTYLMDDKPGIFPRYPAGPTTSLPSARKISQFEGHSTFDLHGHEDYVAALPIAVGTTILMAPEDPERFVTIRSLSGELQLLDGRNLAQNGWFVVRTLLATETTGKAAEWQVEPHTIPGWTRTPVIGFSQVGYHPSQPKRAVIELDANDTPPPTAALIEIRPDGTEVEKAKAEVVPWGSYLRYHYVVADFSSVSDPGLYFIQYGTQKTGAFPIATNVYERVWHPTLDVFFPVQMDHMFVNEAYRVWHGAAHLDDAVQAPLNEQHFDGYRTGATTNTPYEPGERIPGLAVGGWFDAGDFDIQGGSHAMTVSSLVATWETFHPQHDQTLVDQDLRFVDIHRPDGKPDMLQQIEHGALQIAAQYRSIGRLVRGIVDGELHRYHHLGDASTQTDNLIYDPSLKPYQSEGGRSGTPDDRWVYTNESPFSNYSGIGALAAASRALRGFNDPLASDCLALARKAYAEERARPAPPTPPTGFAARLGPLAELTAVAELMAATSEQEYVDRFQELLWPALEQNPGMLLQIATRAIPHMDSAYTARLRPYVERYKVELDGMLEQNPYGVPITTRGWAGNAQVIGWATTNYYLHKAFPDLVGTDLVTRGLDYIFGTHPAHNYSFVSAVGNRSKHVAYGNNRADFAFIAGGVVPGVLVLKPDYPENMDDWPFLWGENEYVIGIGASYIFLANAVQEMLNR
ncbi:MAG: glycoside hydrolase family 9 protein [Acidobacteria bacterium]|nr:glycoside hydrolase family 9 protein [Acidobacteriota bacterium]